MRGTPRRRSFAMGRAGYQLVQHDDGPARGEHPRPRSRRDRTAWSLPWLWQVSAGIELQTKAVEAGRGT